jgi:hypothetical protein
MECVNWHAIKMNYFVVGGKWVHLEGQNYVGLTDKSKHRGKNAAWNSHAG